MTKEHKDKIHDYFGLTYSSYLVLQRSILQSMPNDWQEEFVRLLSELEESTKNLKELPSGYWVRARDKDNKFAIDPYCDYDSGRRRVF